MKKQHMVDVLFVMTLFCVFALSSLCVVYIGSRVYQQTTKSMESNFQTNTALNYVIEKTRQGNCLGNIQIRSIEDQEALVILQSYNDQLYATYIYQYNDQLRELFIKESQAPLLNDGDTIIAATQFEIEKLNNQLLHLTLSFEHQPNQETYISIL